MAIVATEIPTIQATAHPPLAARTPGEGGERL